MKHTILKDTIAITAITLIAGLALGVVNEVTREPIMEQELKAKEEAYKAVFPEAETFGEIVYDEKKAEELQSYLLDNGCPAQKIDEVMTAFDEDQEILGYAFTITSQEGYGGDIQFAMGVSDSGMVNGISILSISETAGLGMKADTEAFKDQFHNKQTERFVYTKDGAENEGEIDAISGATITTNAMVNGANAGLCAFEFISEGGLEG